MSSTPPAPALGLRAVLRAVGMHPEDAAPEHFDLAGRRALCIVFKGKGVACRKAVKVIFIVIEA